VITEALAGGVILRAPKGGDVSGKDCRNATVTGPFTDPSPREKAPEMSDDDDFEDEPTLEEDDIDEDVLEEDFVEDDDVVVDDVIDDDLVDVIDAEIIDVVAVPGVLVAPAEPAEEEEEDDVVDLDEELHPDDVEAPLDALLQERTASATLEDEEEELEDEEVDADAPGDGPTKIVPRRPGEFLCSSCFLVLPRNQLADERRMLCRDCV
jgi:hypothetical protein